MAGGTGQDAPDTQQTSVVLDDSQFQIPDEWGLKEAYNDPQSVVHHGDILYIAGTHSLRDVADDLLIPLHLVRNSQRYQQALAALHRANGRVKYLAGHSLGGAVAAVLQTDLIEARRPRLPLAGIRTHMAATTEQTQYDRSQATAEAICS